MSEQRIVPVILSGGSGTRLWPVSRESFPKQLWPLVSDRSLMQETALRARRPRLRAADRGLQRGAPVPDRRAVARGRHRRTPRIVLEPVGRNSAPAIAAAALLVAEDDPDAVLWMMAADAAIADTDGAARRAARSPRSRRAPARS